MIARLAPIAMAGAMALGLLTPSSASEEAPAKDYLPAAAYERCINTDNYRGSGCFDPVGDIIRTHDHYPDGRRVVTHWQTNYGRSGTCHNAQGAYTMRTCNYDMAENGMVRIRVSLRDGANGTDENMTAWSAWIPIRNY